MSALDQAETVARRNLIASAYEVANTLRQDTEALLKFRDDQFWEGYPRPKANGDNVLRFALIAIRGNSKAQRAWASEWAKRLEPAFEKRIPAEQIPAFLEASAQINTSKRKTRAALKVVEMAQTVVRIGGEAGHRSFEETLEIGERRNFEVIADQRTRIFISVTAPVRPHRRRRRCVDDGYNLDAEKVIQRVPGRAPPG
ncbi:hypothetical protein RPMA_19140 [Tardiphaga alba]|uniref:Uncharacterized protein n=1 Tax=Tardiphaga alba TaxID=340268 RepID=A0ABX8AAB5_9BRAD|nr:hypothetical protein [Tardiphaga alba]QUS40711.1 hypothetical protein RPMA_19140 [Tardiphaga alba]